ncbi:MAG: glutamate dehydrogenase [Halieaceae bacterium]|jgi:glutamate dehydrogenase
MIWEEAKKKLLAQLDKEIGKRLDKVKAGPVREFAEKFYHSFPAEDLKDRLLSDLFGTTYGSWKFLADYTGGDAKVRVFNPDFEKHGWQLNHTVVTVLCPNTPFCVDSVRGELNRRNIAVHSLHSENFRIERSAGKIQRLLTDSEESDVASSESFIYLEVSRHSDAKELLEVGDAIVDVLRDVRLVIESFEAMYKQALVVADTVEKGPDIDGQTAADVAAFCHWLVGGNLTFLGYECFSVSYGKGAPKLKSHAELAIGILTQRKTRGEEHLEKDISLGSRKGDAASERRPQLSFSKSSVRCRVHRTVYPDYIAIKEYDEEGRLLRWHRFLGLFTSRVYTHSLDQIPVIAPKVAACIRSSGLDPAGHEGRELSRILEVLPRDEIFQSTVPELTSTALTVVRLKERRKVRLIMRRDSSGAFFSCMVYSPRDRFTTELRLKMHDILCAAVGALESEFTTFFSESVLARVHFVIRVDPERTIQYDIRSLEREIYEASLYWPDQLQTFLVEEHGEEEGSRLAAIYAEGFSAGYRDHFEPRVAVNDLARILKLSSDTDIRMTFYRLMGEEDHTLHFRVFHRNNPLALSDVMPILENLGMHVAREMPYEVTANDEQSVWIQDFSLVYSLADNIDLSLVETKFKEAFAAIWYGEAESDEFNKLLLGTQLTWREIALLRAYARYMKQIQFAFSSGFVAETLAKHLSITSELFELFDARFCPTEKDDSDARQIEKRLLDQLDQVSNLSEDRVIREYVILILATVRTNYYQLASDDSTKPYISFKMLPEQIPDVPLPKPRFEIFVYSPRVEGVHLRGGAVARGGLRWSERHEDFRTEVLGLVKAQQVKNAVIVPVGAKGGFICKRMPVDASRDQVLAEGVACYQIFIRGLLDITDNLVQGLVVPPANVTRLDGDDTYLVVAADKGTATFSDIANDISAEYDFWLGDAFASGGSIGYDHKKMGITAKGAWVSVQRHFREMDVDVQTTDFSVVGIGDMAGDVFGNGMLLSEHICLVAAFNHRHIFIDPSPDASASFVERKRLFETPGTSWDDYDRNLISKGGGILDRSAKSVNLSPEMKKRFGLRASSMTPAELITALLLAPVDLLWNGGIGTYIKASTESHAEVGDKANDVLRVNAEDLNCKVIGEGGNLGVTQRGRIEFALNGGRVNTDFIDNAGGVDCSDHEVNIKILLNGVVAAGDLTVKQRNKLLVEMTESVSELVLRNNYSQVQAISLAEHEAERRAGEYRRLISRLVEDGKLDRALEFMPEDDVLLERNNRGKSLSRPELAILVSYSKALLKEDLLDPLVTNDSLLSGFVASAFPPKMAELFGDEIADHRLRNEIIATQVANDLVNLMGVHFVPRLSNSTGASPALVASAYVTASQVLGVGECWAAIEALDHRVDSEVQHEMMLNIMRLVRRASRWFIRNRRVSLDPAKEVAVFAPKIVELSAALPNLLQGHLEKSRNSHAKRLLSSGVNKELAEAMAGLQHKYSLLGIIEAARTEKTDAMELAELYFKLGERLKIDWFGSQVVAAKVENNWQAIARETYLDDLEWQQRSLAVGALKHICEKRDADLCIERWIKQQSRLVDRWHDLIVEMRRLQAPEYAMFAVGIRELMDLAQSSVH